MNRPIQHAVCVVLLLCCWMTGSIRAQSEASPPVLLKSDNATESGIPNSYLALLPRTPETLNHDFDPLLPPLASNFVGSWENFSMVPEMGKLAMVKRSILTSNATIPLRIGLSGSDQSFDLAIHLKKKTS